MNGAGLFLLSTGPTLGRCSNYSCPFACALRTSRSRRLRMTWFDSLSRRDDRERTSSAARCFGVRPLPNYSVEGRSSSRPRSPLARNRRVRWMFDCVIRRRQARTVRPDSRPFLGQETGANGSIFLIAATLSAFRRTSPNPASGAFAAQGRRMQSPH